MRVLTGVILLLVSVVVHSQQPTAYDHESFLDLGLKEHSGIEYRYFGCNSPGGLVARVKKDFPSGIDLQINGKQVNNLRLLPFGLHLVRMTDPSGRVIEILYAVSGIEGLLQAPNQDSRPGTCLLSYDKILKAD